MNRRWAWPIGVSAALLVATPISAAEPTGYLVAPPLDPASVLPGPPQPGEAMALAEQRDYAASVRMVGTERWGEAIADSDESIPAILQKFELAAGTSLSKTAAPRLHHLLQRAFKDMGPSVRAAKDYYDRARPYAHDRSPICNPMPDAERSKASRSYPSGHAVSGWFTAYMLAGLLPDAASSIIARANLFAQSRVVCRVHYQSDVLAGQLLAAALLARLQGNAEFEEDFRAARIELASVRSKHSR